MKNYRELDVWQDSMTLVENVYKILHGFPKAETFGLCDQLRRSVVSVPSNIAEGFGRGSTKDFVHFLYTARGSLYEAHTQVEVAQRLGYIESIEELSDQFNAVARRLNSLIKSLMAKIQ